MQFQPWNLVKRVLLFVVLAPVAIGLLHWVGASQPLGGVLSFIAGVTIGLIGMHFWPMFEYDR